MEERDPVDELEVEVDQALIEKRRIIGLDRRAAGAFLLLAPLVVLISRSFWTLLIVIPMYLGIRYLMRKDPDKIDVYQIYKTQHDHYVPRATRTQKRNKRPFGFGRDFPCY
nr:VirB3 family type IV secretion system protein [Achromobacter ruhlandii]